MKLTAAIVSIFLVLFGFAGGGGSSSGGGGGGGGGGSSFDSGSSSDPDFSSHSGSYSDFEVIAFIVAAVIMTVAYIWDFFDVKHKRHRATKKTIAEMNAANHETPQEKRIREQAEQIFMTYQADWTNLNTANIATYTTLEYCQHATLMLELLKSLHRVNKVSQLEVEGAYVMASVKDDTPLPINLQIKIYFSGLDEVIDTKTGETLYSDHAKNIHESWNFIYDGTTLKLSGISQPTESADHLVLDLFHFAKKHQLYYSLDWGRYALPSRGLIFGRAQMARADVNNHIIGKWGDALIQMYTYAEDPKTSQLYYLVGQIILPKEYKGVIVRSRHDNTTTDKRIDDTYEEIELEWPDFNDRYEVYAASADALPAFELLNPQFMTYLYDKNPDYSMEVADNSIYIFMRNFEATEQDYADMLDVLSAAYKELKQ